MSLASMRTSRSRRLAALAVAATLSLSGLAACGSSSDSGGSGSSSGKKSGFNIGVANGYTGNTWRTQMLANLKTVGDQLKSDGKIKSLTIESSPADAATQLTQIQDLIRKKVDAILIAPVNAAVAQTAVTRIKAAGIKPYIITDPAPTKDATNIVGGDGTWWAVQANWLVEQLGDKPAKVVMVTGLAGNASDSVRTASVKTILAKHPNIDVVASVPGDWDPGKARAAMGPVLATNPKIDAVLEQDIMAPGVIQAFKAANRPVPTIMTGDYTAAFLKLWKTMPNLKSIGVPYSPTLGSDALKIIVRMLAGEKLKAGVLGDNEVSPSIKDNALLMPPALAITRDGKRGSWTPDNMKVISLDDALKQVDGKPDTFAVEAPITDEEIDGFFSK